MKFLGEMLNFFRKRLKNVVQKISAKISVQFQKFPVSEVLDPLVLSSESCFCDL